MKVALEKVYQCDYCGKKGRSAGAMVRHERGCPQKPENKHICFEFCKHLKKETETIWTEEGEPWTKVTHFTCLALNKKMYSYKLEKRNEFKSSWVSGLTRMPLDCNKYEVMTEHEKQEKYQ